MAEAERILIVDDETSSLELLARVLGKEGFDIFFAESGAEALKLVKKNDYDLFLLDVQMPGMDGFELLGRIRERKGPDICAIFLTGLVGVEHVVSAFSSGGSDYITKPFCSEEVLARVKLHLEIRRHRRHLGELVARRTEELRATVKTLEDEVAARRKAETALERKNIALAEVLSHLEEEKRLLRRGISESLDALVRPVADRLRASGDSPRREHVEVLLKQLDEIFQPFADRLKELKARLSPQEFEICSLIRSGLESKDVARALDISVETVKWHRGNIRKKLGLESRDEDLFEYLSDLK